jgi:membrane protease YdiL (CAAX protease family)
MRVTPFFMVLPHAHAAWEDERVNVDRPNAPDPSAPTSLVGAAGWLGPQPRPWGCPPDPVFAGALLAALPVWLGLGMWVGPAMRAPHGAWAWLSLLLVQPLLEELVFRGLLQGLALAWLSRHGSAWRLGPLSLANLLVSAGFVLLHLRAQPLAWAMAVAAPSLVLGHLRERYGSVWPPVLVHAFYNTGFGLVAWLAHA